MSNFCEHCKVNVDKNTIHCPLCGAFIEDAIVDESSRHFPKYKPFTEKHDTTTNVLIKLLLLGLLISMGLDLFIFKTVSFSLYVLVSVFYVILVVLLPIKKKASMEQIMTRLACYTAGLLLFIELITNSFGWGVCFAIPGVWLGIDILAGILMLAYGYVNFEMFKPMLSIAVISTVALILLLSFGQVTWLMLSTMFLSWTEIALMFMFRFKRSIRSLKKDFRI